MLSCVCDGVRTLFAIQNLRIPGFAFGGASTRAIVGGVGDSGSSTELADLVVRIANIVGEDKSCLPEIRDPFR